MLLAKGRGIVDIPSNHSVDKAVGLMRCAPCPMHGRCSPLSLSERRPRDRCPHGWRPLHTGRRRASQ